MHTSISIHVREWMWRVKYDVDIAPLAHDHFDYDESTKNLHFKRRQKMNDTTECLSTKTADINFTKSFSLINSDEIKHLSVHEIVDLVNKRVSKGMSLYEGPDTLEGIPTWSTKKHPASRHVIKFYHVEEVPQEVLPSEQPVDERIVRDIFERIIKAGIKKA